MNTNDITSLLTKYIGKDIDKVDLNAMTIEMTKLAIANKVSLDIVVTNNIIDSINIKSK